MKEAEENQRFPEFIELSYLSCFHMKRTAKEFITTLSVSMGKLNPHAALVGFRLSFTHRFSTPE